MEGIGCKKESVEHSGKGKRNSTDDVSYSQIKYEVPACKRILVACKNELIPK